MIHLDLFSGIGGFALSARWMGWETLAFVEREPFCQEVLKTQFPNTPIFNDIYQFGTKELCSLNWEKQKEANRHYSILTGGFP